jgi:hypothetical protein
MVSVQPGRLATWLIITGLLLAAPMAHAAVLPSPQPVFTKTLPGPLSASEHVYFEDFAWCQSPPCGFDEGPRLSQKMSGATGSFSVSSDAWQITAGGRDGTAAVTYTDPGWQFGQPVMELTVRPDRGIANTGKTIEIGLIAAGAPHALFVDGGIRVQLQAYDDNLQLLSHPQDCLVVAGLPVGDGYHELLPLNPHCQTVPLTTKLVITITVEEGLATGLQDKVAIDTIKIRRA